MRGMSAKDRAFERERQRLLSRIRELEENVGDKDLEMAKLHAAMQKKEARIRELEQQMKTLSRALSRDDLQLLLDSKKKQSELADNLSVLFRFTGMY